GGRAGERSRALSDVGARRRGGEILPAGPPAPLMELPASRTFAVAPAREAGELAAAPPLPSTDRDVVVVTDPHYNALVAHEIVGHPSELDRGLKMEMAYAGRSWLLGGLGDTQVGRAVASPLVSAFSDPALPGYGHYAYDHDGTPARRVVHIDRGIYQGFMNSRQTAPIFRTQPHRHHKASDA